jgi:NADH-quinone oxidoreductase subunit J
MDTLVFYVVAAGALAAALAMVLSPNAVYAALFLVGTQIALAILFLLQGAFFVAALQVIVYTGAIMVLFVFVVMLLGVDKHEALVEPLKFQRPAAVGLGIILIAEVAYLGLGQTIHINAAPANRVLAGEGNVEAVARVLFTKWALPFEATSVLLVVAVVGVMVLAAKRVMAE